MLEGSTRTKTFRRGGLLPCGTGEGIVNSRRFHSKVDFIVQGAGGTRCKGEHDSAKGRTVRVTDCMPNRCTNE